MFMPEAIGSAVRNGRNVWTPVEKRRYVAPEPNIKTGWLSRYARMVTSANLGAVLK